MEKAFNMQVFNGYNVCAWVDGLMVYANGLIKQIKQTIKQKQKENGLMVNKTEHLTLQNHSNDREHHPAEQ